MEQGHFTSLLILLDLALTMDIDIEIEKVNQRESWKQGCRAVFAGFVASAHPRGVRPPSTKVMINGSYQQTSICFG